MYSNSMYSDSHFSYRLTLVEGPSSEDITSVGKARSSWTEDVELTAAKLWARLTLLPPCPPDCAAAGIHPEPSRHRLGAGVLIIGEVTVF